MSAKISGKDNPASLSFVFIGRENIKNQIKTERLVTSIARGSIKLYLQHFFENGLKKESYYRWRVYKGIRSPT